MNRIQALMMASMLVFSAHAQEVSPGKEISGVVRVIRAHPETEVFFKDFKDSVFIGKDSKHNQFYEACEESRKKGTPVKLVIHPISRRVLRLPAAAAGATQDPKSDSPVFVPLPSSDEENSK
ncbi:MAG: hypothetical protein ACAH59_10705 [Pseudobdellovibrionaceae bacterium]